MNMSKHFLPDYDDWGDPTIEIEKHLKVPVQRVKHVPQWTGDPPFHILGCTWHHRNSQGPLTEEKFRRDMAGAYADLAAELNHYERFLAYPITYRPPVVVGVAYHDWTGAAYPFDIRTITTLDHNIPAEGDTVETGLTFNIITLISAQNSNKEQTS